MKKSPSILIALLAVPVGTGLYAAVQMASVMGGVDGWVTSMLVCTAGAAAHAAIGIAHRCAG